MDILDNYAIRIGESPKELKDDYFSSPEDEQLIFLQHVTQYMQTGGPIQQQGQGEDIAMQIIQMFAEATQQDPNTIMQQLQQMSPEEQSQAIEQMTASLEQSQMQTGGYDDVSMQGYSDNSPYKEYDMLPIDTNILTMEKTGIPLIGVGNQSGEMQYMEPYSDDYYFPNDENVTEYPVYQTGPDKSKELEALLNKSKKEYEQKKESLLKQAQTAENKRKLAKLQEVYNVESRKLNADLERYKDSVKFVEKNIKTYNPDRKIYNFISDKQTPDESLKALKNIEEGIKLRANNINKVLDLKNYNKIPTYPLAGDKAINWQELNGTSVSKPSPIIKKEDGKFVLQPTGANTPKAIETETAPPASNYSSNNKGRSSSGRTSPYFPVTSDKNQWTDQWEQFLSGKGLIDDSKPSYSVDEIDDLVFDYVKNHPNEFEGNTYLKNKNLSTLLTDGKYGKVHESFLPPASRIDFGNVAPITPRGLSLSDIKLDTRFEKEGVRPAGIQYSPKIDGITPNKPPAKSMYKFNTSSVLGDAINNYKVSKAFEPIDLPYFEDVDYKMPEVQLYDPRPGLQAISDSFSPYKNSINPNSATGQAVLSSLATKEADAMQKHSNDVQQQNMQIQNQRETMVADLYNKINAGRQSARTRYVDDVYRTEANRDAIIDTTLANNYNKGLEQNAYERMLAFNPYLEDKSGIVGNLLGKRKFSFDKEAARQANFGSTTTTNNKDELLKMKKQLDEALAQMPKDEINT